MKNLKTLFLIAIMCIAAVYCSAQSNAPENFKKFWKSYTCNAYPKNIAQTALCCIMAGKDDKAKVSLVKPTIKETQKYGGTINFIVEKDCDHISVCPAAFNDNNLEWVFNNKK